jgi:hypothetical protein
MFAQADSLWRCAPNFVGKPAEAFKDFDDAVSVPYDSDLYPVTRVNVATDISVGIMGLQFEYQRINTLPTLKVLVCILCC